MSRAVLEELRLYLEVTSALAKSVLRTLNTLPPMYFAGGSVAIPFARGQPVERDKRKNAAGRRVAHELGSIKCPLPVSKTTVKGFGLGPERPGGERRAGQRPPSPKA